MIELKDKLFESNMTYGRYLELAHDINLCLTKEEIADGWHFCYDFDGLLIHKKSPEFNYCTCYNDDK